MLQDVAGSLLLQPAALGQPGRPLPEPAQVYWPEMSLASVYRFLRGRSTLDPRPRRKRGCRSVTFREGRSPP